MIVAALRAASAVPAATGPPCARTASAAASRKPIGGGAAQLQVEGAQCDVGGLCRRIACIDLDT
jgi:hypothetical protein